MSEQETAGSDKHEDNQWEARQMSIKRGSLGLC